MDPPSQADAATQCSLPWTSHAISTAVRKESDLLPSVVRGRLLPLAPPLELGEHEAAVQCSLPWLSTAVAAEQTMTAVAVAVPVAEGVPVIELEGSSVTALLPLVLSIQCRGTLITLRLSNCDRLLSLPESIDSLAVLEQLELRVCIHLTALPASVSRLTRLKTLVVTDCDALITLPELSSCDYFISTKYCRP